VTGLWALGSGLYDQGLISRRRMFLLCHLLPSRHSLLQQKEESRGLDRAAVYVSCQAAAREVFPHNFLSSQHPDLFSETSKRPDRN
jgi:hypothetical protein